MVCPDLPKKQNKNSGYEEMRQDCIELKLSNIKSLTHEITNDFVKFYFHIHLQPINLTHNTAF